MTNPTSAINPSEESIAALARLADEDPIIMVNLLKFKEGDGQERYGKYAAVSGQEVAARGGRVIYSGRSIGGTDWDIVALVYYPRRAAYLDMQNSDAYLNAIPDRTAGLERRLLFAFRRREGTPALDDVSRKDEEEILVVNLLAYKGDSGKAEYGQYGQTASELIGERGGEMVLYLEAEQAMVSDDDWENFVLVRYPSLEALQNMIRTEAWQKADREHRQVGLANTIAFPTRQTNLR